MAESIRLATTEAFCSESFSMYSRSETRCRIARRDQTTFIAGLLFRPVYPTSLAISRPFHD